MVKFDIKMQDIVFYKLENLTSSISQIFNELFEGLKYEFRCESLRNNHQFNSTLDSEIAGTLARAGFTRLDLKLTLRLI